MDLDRVLTLALSISLGIILATGLFTLVALDYLGVIY